MKIQLLFLMECPFCRKTERNVRDVLRSMGIKAQVHKIIIDNKEKAKKYRFLGSPTVRIDGRDIQKLVSKRRCPACTQATGTCVRCRVYFYRGRRYAYPPKTMIKEAIASVI